MFNILRYQQLAMKAQDFNQEADELFDKVEALEKEKKSRDWHIFLYKDAIETLKEWPRGKPAGYKPPEVLREQREKEAEKKRQAEELRKKFERERENTPSALRSKALDAFLAKDPDFLIRTPAPAYMERKFLQPAQKKRLDAARAVWPIRFGGTELPEVMTAAELNQALRLGSEILFPDDRPMGFIDTLRSKQT